MNYKKLESTDDDVWFSGAENVSPKVFLAGNPVVSASQLALNRGEPTAVLDFGSTRVRMFTPHGNDGGEIIGCKIDSEDYQTYMEDPHKLSQYAAVFLPDTRIYTNKSLGSYLDGLTYNQGTGFLDLRNPICVLGALSFMQEKQDDDADSMLASQLTRYSKLIKTDMDPILLYQIWQSEVPNVQRQHYEQTYGSKASLPEIKDSINPQISAALYALRNSCTASAFSDDGLTVTYLRLGKDRRLQMIETTRESYLSELPRLSSPIKREYWPKPVISRYD